MKTKENPHRQVELRSGNRTRMVNVPDHPKLKVGNTLRLRDEEEFWGIAWVSVTVTNKADLHTDWNNNI
jgi:hypothetical protein